MAACTSCGLCRLSAASDASACAAIRDRQTALAQALLRRPDGAQCHGGGAVTLRFGVDQTCGEREELPHARRLQSWRCRDTHDARQALRAAGAGDVPSVTSADPPPYRRRDASHSQVPSNRTYIRTLHAATLACRVFDGANHVGICARHVLKNSRDRSRMKYCRTVNHWHPAGCRRARGDDGGHRPSRTAASHIESWLRLRYAMSPSRSMRRGLFHLRLLNPARHRRRPRVRLALAQHEAGCLGFDRRSPSYGHAR